MIGSGYVLNLDCDREGCGEKLRLIQPTGAEAWRKARAAGWQAFQTRRKCVCPGCRADGFNINPNTGAVYRKPVTATK